jgi:leucyl/phenylalanyl-tRNA--protein transferase
VLWWSPDPRMVLIVDEFRAARSLRRTIRAALAAGRLEVSADRDFRAVIEACRAPRRGQDGTWITDEIVEAYCELHRIDCAHSIEVRLDGELAGGLYGVALGRMFFGESMFSTVRDASKIALAALVALLKREQVRVIDCQQNTPHLASLGAREIERSEFRAHLASAVRQPPVDWSVYRSGDLNHLLSSY